MDLNSVQLIGNLCKDPETRFLQTGSQVCKMRLAVNRKAGKDKDETLFIDVEAWNKTAEHCSQYLSKGSQVLVSGRLKQDTYTTQDGQERTVFVVVADRVSFGSSPNRDQQGGNGRASSDPAQARYNAARGYQAGQPLPAGGAPEDEGNLPF